MSPSSILFLIGSFAVFLGERMFEGDDMVRWGLDGLGVLLGLAALAVRASTLGRHPTATKLVLGFYALSMTSLLLYVASGKDVLGGLGVDAERMKELRTALHALVPLVWVVGALPALSIDRTLHASPKSVHPLRLRTALEGGFAVALGLAMLFPMNWLAQEYNKRWDFGFFKTTQVGDSTAALVANMEEPLRIVLFFPSSSEVLREVEPYFDDLEGEHATVEVMDQAMAPDLAKEWKVRENGTVALVKGEDVETVKIGDKIDSARKELRKLDSKVQTALLKLAREKRTAYFTVGHGENYWKNAPTEAENTDTVKKVLEQLNFKVKELGADDGLAQAVPDDAALVFVVAPKKPFLPEEITALREYRDRGGALFLMLEKPEDADPALPALLGVDYEPGPLLSDKSYVKITNGIADRVNVVSNKFSSHESVTTLSKNSAQAAFITPEAGSVKEAAEHPGKVTITIKGMPEWWIDANGNYEYDKDAEKRGGHDLAAIASGPAANDKEWRGAVIADATWASNMVLKQVQANAYYLVDTVAWLTEDPALSGEVQNEEDVKIQHTKEGDALWFYGTSLLVPSLVFVGGMLRVGNRRRRKDATAREAA